MAPILPQSACIKISLNLLLRKTHITLKMNISVKKSCLSVIVNALLQTSDVFQLLMNAYRVRVSSTTVESSVIFPSSNVTFLLVDVKESSNEVNSDSEHLVEAIIKRIDKLIRLHKSCYVLIQATSYADCRVSQIFSAIQNRYLFSCLKLIPVHNAQQAVQCMQEIVNISTKPTSDALRNGFQQVIDNQLIAEQCQQNALRSIGLTDHECMVLTDGLGSLANIACASEEELLDCSLSVSSSKAVLNFLHAPAEQPNKQI